MYKRWAGSEHPKSLGISTLQPLANLGKSGKAVPLLAALLHMVPTWLGVGLELWVVGQKERPSLDISLFYIIGDQPIVVCKASSQGCGELG